MQLSRGCKIWLVVAGIFALAGLYLLWDAYSVRQAWRRTAEAVPAEFAVDLGQAGTYSGQFTHMSTPYFGLDIRLHVDPHFRSHDEAEKALQGLQATLRIGKEGSDASVSRTLSADSLRPGPWSHTDLRTLPDGPYFYFLTDLGPRRTTRAVVNVNEPAEGLADREQRLVMRYAICGVGAFGGPLLEACLGGLLLLPGVITGLVIGCLRLRSGRAADTDDRTEEAE